MRFLALGCLVIVPFTAYASDERTPDPLPAIAQTGPTSPSAAGKEKEFSIKTWGEIEAASLQVLLQQALDNPENSKGKALKEALGKSAPKVTVWTNYPPADNTGGLPEPYVSISFDAVPTIFGNTDVEKLATDFVSDELGQHYFSQEFIKALPDQMKEGNWVKPSYLKTWVGPEDLSGNPFLTPRGLTMRWQALAFTLGYLPHPGSTFSIAFTPAVCQEMSVKAVRAGLYDDAIALANHGLRQSPVDPAFLYIRAYCEILLGRGDTATGTIKDLKATQRFPYPLRERLNGPVAVYLWQAYESLK